MRSQNDRKAKSVYMGEPEPPLAWQVRELALRVEALERDNRDIRAALLPAAIVGPSVVELDLQKIAAEILRLSGLGYAASVIQRQWVVNKLQERSGLDDRTVDRRIRHYLAVQGIDAVGKHWQTFVAHVLENPARFRS